MDFAINIDKLVLANLMGEVMDEIVEVSYTVSYRSELPQRKWPYQILPSRPGQKCQNVKISLHFADIMMSKFHVLQPYVH